MKSDQPSSARGPAGGPASGPVRGIEYWRSLEHLADAPEVRELIGKEFPGYDADELVSGSRRKFLKMMGASMALAGVTLTGCRRWPEEKLAPYSTNPRDRMPGVPEQYATAFEIGGVAQPLLVTSYDGRPIKIEGNPSHPFSWTVQNKLGSADAFAQATLLDMYDPQRSRSVVKYAPARAESNWTQFAAFATAHFAGLKGNGKGVAVLSEAASGPSVADMRKRFLEAFPGARWYEYEPVTRDNETEGARMAFGKPVRTLLHLDKARTVVLLDADVLGMHPAHVKYASDWSHLRRSADKGEMSRVYVAEAGFSLTGSNADVRLPVNPARLYAITRAIAAKLGVAGVAGDEKLSELETKFVDSAAGDLQSAGHDGVVASGGVMPAAGQALVHAINEKLGAVGNTVTLLEDTTVNDVSHSQAIAQLAAEINAGQFQTLLIIGGNPAYDAPADVAFDKAIAKVPVSIHLALYENETSQLCKWHLPRAHYLESWGDARAWDGTAGIVQPLIMPLFDGKSTIEVLAMLAGDSITDGHEILKRTWAEMLDKTGFDLALRKVIESGLLPGSEFKTAQVQIKSQEFPPSAAPAGGYYLRFQPDWHAFDGRFANNGWLQETPDPLTKLVWDNAALVSKKDADKLGLTTGTLLRIDTAEKYGSHFVEVATYVMPGQPEGVISLPLGYGRQSSGHIGEGLGHNTYKVRTSEGALLNSGAKLTLGSGSYSLVSTQDHYLFDTIGFEGTKKRIGDKNESGMIIREATLAEFKENPRAVHGNSSKRRIGLQLFEEPARLTDTHAWGMAIDMNSCIGCNACTIACQSENNIPVVGKAQANMHRSMNWIRIDRYFKADDRNAEDPGIEVVYQPMTCQHCENAPCEQVCPVGATVHDTEGINTMVYNRCIGTRYCSNNCPYKVRRFNYLDYQSQDPRQNWAKPYLNIPDQQQLQEVNKIKWMLFNPEVTVRMRGVMEKCTYCVQRVHRTTQAKRAEGGHVVDGDIITACQQACPTQAIVFGDLNDKSSKVSKLHQNPRAYGVLQEELDTRPRTQYLAKIRNPGGGQANHEA